MQKVTIDRVNRKVFVSPPVLDSSCWCLMGLVESWSSVRRHFSLNQQKQILRAWISVAGGNEK